MNAWLLDGKVIVDETGKLILCDDCPCVAGCASGELASSYTLSRPDIASGAPQIVTANFDFTGSMNGCETSDSGQDLDCPYFGTLYAFGFFEVKLWRNGVSGLWTITRDACGGNPGAKNDGIDHPVGTYANGGVVS